MKFKKILLSLLICLSCFVQAKNITISRLTCEMQEGLVVVEGSPRLGWVMESPENGTRQSAYEIDIREAFTGRSVWNSGKVYSSQSQLVSTKGADIRPDNSFNYSWRVRVWDETDTPSEWSSEAKFRATRLAFFHMPPVLIVCFHYVHNHRGGKKSARRSLHYRTRQYGIQC